MFIEMKDFVRNYSLRTYNEDYNVICDLSYKWKMNKSRSRKYVRELRDYLNKYGIFCDGILVFEYSKIERQLHNHILMYCKNEKFYKVNGMIQKLADHAKSSNEPWSVDQSHNACEFVKRFSGEMQVSFFNKIMDCGNLDTIMRVHKLIGRTIVDLVNTSDKIVK